MPSRISETVLVHLYRGEVARSDAWRGRLDNTTNWALTVTAGVVSVAFSSPRTPHTVLLAGDFLILTFLLIEARRYRYYDLWIRRVRLLEEAFVASVLRAEAPDADALRELAELITRPRLTVSFLDAAGLRLRRTYAPVLLVTFIAWLVKLGSQPTATSVTQVVGRAHVGPIPGLVTFALVILALCGGVALYLRSFLRPLPSGELRALRGRRRPIATLFTRALSTRGAKIR